MQAATMQPVAGEGKELAALAGAVAVVAVPSPASSPTEPTPGPEQPAERAWSPDQRPDLTPDQPPAQPPPRQAQSPFMAPGQPPYGTPEGSPAARPASELETRGDALSPSADPTSTRIKMSSIVSKAVMDALSAMSNSPRSLSGLPGSRAAEPPADRCSSTAPGSSSPYSLEPAKARPLHEHKEFPIVVMCAVFLATVAGWVNVVSMISFRKGVTHVSGTSTMLGKKAVQESWLELAEFAVLLISFCFGAGASGLAVGNTKFVLGQKYGTVLVVIGILLAAGVGAQGLWPPCSLSGEAECVDKYYCTWGAAAGQCEGGLWPEFLVLTLWALAMGCQNGMGTSVSGAVMRTTHVTGVVTDLGLTIGQWLRQKWLGSGGSPDLWKLRLHGPILVAFVSGGVLGAVAHDLLGDRAVLPPAFLYVVGGLVYNLGLRYGVFNLYLEENLMQEKIQAVEVAFAEAVATALEEAAADPAVETDDDIVGLDPNAGDLISPVINHRSMPAVSHMLHFRRQPVPPAPPTTPVASA